MLSSLWAITKNSVIEIIRQPVYVILLAGGLVLIALSPHITMFSMTEDEKLMVDMSLATMLLLGATMGVFGAGQVITREIETQTVGAVISKPVGRFTFILSKFLAVSVAVAIASYLMAAMLLITLRFGVISKAGEYVDPVPLLGQWVPLALTVGLGLLFNFLYRWNFSSTAVFLALILYSVALGLQLLIPPPNVKHVVMYLVADKNMDQVAISALLVFLAVWAMSAVAVAASTRANIVLSALVCVVVFFGGMVMQFLLSSFSLHACQVRLQGGGVVVASSLERALNADWPLRHYLKDLEVVDVPRKQVTYLKQDGTKATFQERADPNIEVERVVEKVTDTAIRMRLKPHEDLAPVDLAERVMKQVGFREGAGGQFLKSTIEVWPSYHPIGRVLPHFYVFWVGDQLMSEKPYIPLSFVGRAALYATAYCVGMLFLAAFLFEGREII